ncbi:MAG: DUF3365 domain-containing protein [Gammaproteobacteria bacterium]|nr:DUF3365 domain-containing protein [Gammaproteobacteria bacterium]
MFSRLSIQIKFFLVFSVAIFLVVAALLVGVQGLKEKQLRHEAIAVADQVVSFRSWVANTGVVWTDKLTSDFHDFLGRREDAAGNFFFSKNPALATRELSNISSKTSTRATFTVTSDRYRNPKNKPDAFELEALNFFKKEDASDYYDRFENNQYRYTQPLFVKKACLRCHGDPAEAPPEVIEKYGDKQAFGYKIGDVRGIISVKLPDINVLGVIDSFLNPITIVLFVLAFLITFLFTQKILIRRLQDLSKMTENIAKGQLSQKLPLDSKSKDEIMQVSHAVDMLRKSLDIAMRHMEKLKHK